MKSIPNYRYEMRCVWCGKELTTKKTLLAFYGYEEDKQINVGTLAGGRFCNWDCIEKWFEHRRGKEES